VVGPLRSHEQWDAADKARRLAAIAHDISTTPPNPDKSLKPSRRKLSKAPERNRATVSPFLVGSSGAPIAKREASHITGGGSEEAVSDAPSPQGVKRTLPAKGRKKKQWK
jgi:hypothetical protein